MFAYCNNSPIIKADYDGYAQRVIIYDNTGGDSEFLADFAEYLKEKYEGAGDDVELIPVSSIDEFCEAWDSLGDGVYDSLDIILHGAPGVIGCGTTSSGTRARLGNNSSYKCQYDYDHLSDITINDRITLYSCNGGTYYEGGSVAQNLANKGHARVTAVSGSKCYIGNGLLQHCAGPLPLWGTWRTFDSNPKPWGRPSGWNRRMEK